MNQDFNFIQDHQFKRILIRDYVELNNCLESKAFKSVLVLSGSIIEALLLEFLLNNPPNGYTKSKINKLKFFELIELSETINLISKTTKDLSTVIREYRNYVHPNKELRSKSDINEDKAVIACRLVNMVISSVKENHPKLYGNKAEDVFSKLHSDSHSRKILNYLLDKMNQNEIDLLYQKFISFYLLSDSINYSDRNFVYFGKEKLEEFVSESIIKSYVFKIEQEITNGSKEQAERLFELFGDKLNYYSQDSINTILIYIYSCLGVCSSYSVNENLYNYSSKGIITKMNLYLDNSKSYYSTHLNVMESIIERIADLKEDWDKYSTREAFNYLRQGISDVEYEKLIHKEALQPNIADFTKILNDSDLLPF
ncbi:hypothetical protein JCM19314_729 [Nonlabens ulvanivorans]|uniref:DUF4145 domain-containing protein n=1 Tax=Nonlabens ulvanivorans TaxID=906888 RepID=A0A090QDU9_NONUL|nr:hypothetical protein [Nonlabens ulvanivorans]GAL01285.1 hypothetical protein JCM19314_729 [Nonlabens ulvanivorans]|tara:strand:- start:365 stop:1471 length:1107 start_codon:yes stop_codon:yes gene_type:complete